MNKYKIVLITALTLLLVGCGNQQVFDTSYSFNKAFCYQGNEEQVYEIKTWKTYDDGEQLQIKTTDDKTYLLSMNYCRLEE